MAQIMVEERVLVLCVDRDNDVGEKLGIKTPVIGRDEVLKVGIDFIIKYPDDSDGNAIFGAIKVYDSLKAIYGNNLEIALVAGSSSGDIDADLKVMAELDKVLSVFNADGIILVSDGPSDEVVLPLIQSRRTVISVKRIVVKQTRGVEDFAVLTRYYLRKAFLEPEWRPYTLGLPGLIIALYGVWLLIPPSIKPIIASSLSLILGLALIFVAFNIYRPIVLFIRRYEATFFTMLVTAVIIGMYLNAYSTVLRSNPYALFIGKPLTLPELLGVIYGALIAVLVLETYAKTHRIPYGYIASISLISPLTGLSSVIAPGFNIESLMFFLLVYISINILVLLMIFLIRRYERRIRLRA